ncbi:MAG: SHOCT domain-containing protein [Oscillospiraceae bacterium]|nr:SHOCT domain-containing protein [Oscillospiraceae bacterium]
MAEYLFVYSLVSLIIAAGLGFIPAAIAKKKGYNFGLWWLYGWLLFIVAIIHVSLIPDKNAAQTDSPVYQATSAQSAADELRKYKELTDSGVITEEEFAAKKKEQLLKLL